MGCAGSGETSGADRPSPRDAMTVTQTLPGVSMRIEVATAALADDLARLLCRCGYTEVCVEGRFVDIGRANPELPRLEDIRLAALVDVWRKRHAGALAVRRR